jgi:hypothetical protein
MFVDVVVSHSGFGVREKLILHEVGYWPTVK